VTLAIGIGANTAIVSLLQTVLLRELPVKDAEELMFVRTAGDRGLGGAPPYPSFERIRDEFSFSRMAAFATDELRVEVDGSVEQMYGQVDPQRHPGSGLGPGPGSGLGPGPGSGLGPGPGRGPGPGLRRKNSNALWKFPPTVDGISNMTACTGQF